jgi:hypothetical protein
MRRREFIMLLRQRAGAVCSRRRGSQQAEMRRIRASRQRPTDRFGRRRTFYLLNAACKPF